MSNPSVSVARGRARPFWFGCPVVFSGSVSRVHGEPVPGDFVDVLDDMGQLIGRGFFNPGSSYRVRIVARPGEPDTAAAIIARRIADAFRVRAAFGIPSDRTDVYRLFNSEGDGLSGMTIDVFSRTVVVMESALWVSRFRRLIVECLEAGLGPGISVLFRVVGGIRGLEGIMAEDEGTAPVEPIKVVENGLGFLTRPGAGQKTGFYADQRENRLAIRDLCVDADVLDLFCFSGGFALNAASAGAKKITAVDSSADAIAAAAANAAINGFDERISFVEQDALKFLAGAREHDVVVCDPPKLASGRSSMESGLKHYARLNVAAMKALRDGGILVTCSCSSVVRRDMFLEMLRDAAVSAGRVISVLDVRGAGRDHPINPSWTEGEYLKVATVVVRDPSRA